MLTFGRHFQQNAAVAMVEAPAGRSLALALNTQQEENKTRAESRHQSGSDHWIGSIDLGQTPSSRRTLAAVFSVSARLLCPQIANLDRSDASVEFNL